MLFKNLRKLQEIEEEEDDISIDESEEEYQTEEIRGTIEELSDAVAAMKELVLTTLRDQEECADPEEEKIEMPTEVFRSHLKIYWDDQYIEEIYPNLKSFEQIQSHLKEINYQFIHLEISKFRYRILRNILVSKLTFLIRRILEKIY